MTSTEDLSVISPPHFYFVTFYTRFKRLKVKSVRQVAYHDRIYGAGIYSHKHCPKSRWLGSHFRSVFERFKFEIPALRRLYSLPCNMLLSLPSWTVFTSFCAWQISGYNMLWMHSGVPLPIYNPTARKEWVVSAKRRPLYPLKKSPCQGTEIYYAVVLAFILWNIHFALHTFQFIDYQQS